MECKKGDKVKFRTAEDSGEVERLHRIGIVMDERSPGFVELMLPQKRMDYRVTPDQIVENLGSVFK